MNAVAKCQIKFFIAIKIQLVLGLSNKILWRRLPRRTQLVCVLLAVTARGWRVGSKLQYAFTALLILPVDILVQCQEFEIARASNSILAVDSLDPVD